MFMLRDFSDDWKIPEAKFQSLEVFASDAREEPFLPQTV
jgi:hypothetical protein